MREIRQIAIPPKLITTYEEKDFVKCSFCGKEATGEQTSRTNIDWHDKQFAVAETAIYMKTGSSFPEGGSGHYLEIHACPNCFKEKIIKVLEACALPEGIKFQEVDWEW